MRVFVSSTFTDLVEYRKAAISGLNQVGHDVVSMEDFTAASAPPVEEVIRRLDSCDVYVGVFGWRYGYCPTEADCPPTIDYPDTFEAPHTSITHLEYLRAKQKHLHVLAFLVDDAAPWPPMLMDAMSPLPEPVAPPDQRRAAPGSQIHELRAALRREHIVSTFSSPSELQARVVAAVTNLGMGIGLERSRRPLGQPVKGIPDSSIAGEIEAEILGAIEDDRRFTTIDLATEWWSTRLFLLAALARSLTSIARVVVVQGSMFVGMTSVETVVRWLGSVEPALSTADSLLIDDPSQPPKAALVSALTRWQNGLVVADEQSVKVDLDGSTLIHYFGDAFLTSPVVVDDLERVTILDLRAILSYPNDFVPVVARPDLVVEGEEEDPATTDEADAGPPPSIHIVDKQVLNADFAARYLDDVMKQARL